MNQQMLFLSSTLACLTLAFPTGDPPAVAQTEATKEQVTVILKDFSVHAATKQAKAGQLTFEAVNEGIRTHELVFLRTDLRITDLPRKKTKSQPGIMTEYLVDENGIHIEIVDEIEEFPSGTIRKKTVSLDPGRYVLFCNIPGHFDKGMHTLLHIIE